MRTSVVGLLGAAKGRVVDALHAQVCTAAQLAEILDVSPTAVRAQLRELSAEGLVYGEAQKSGAMGRPSEIWALTEAAYRLYDPDESQVALNMVQYLRTTHGADDADAFLSEFIRSHFAAYEEELASIDDPLERARRLAELMTASGKPTEVIENEDEGEITLRHYHCSMSGVAKQSPAMCQAERAEMSRLLQIGFADTKTVADGDASCACTIKFEDQNH